MSKTDTTSWSSVDDFVEAYESSRELGNRTSLLEFLPHADHALYLQVASELIRVDMEHSWNEGQSKRLLNYQNILPDVFQEKKVVQEVAFEEYRLRLQAGEKVTAEAYGQQYGIETSHWPQWEVSDEGTHETSKERPRAPELWQGTMELVDDVQSFPSVGDDFLGFSLQKELGRGAFAHVFLAQQGELSDRLIVLKIASGYSLEPQHLARLQHTNIVPIYSVHRLDKLTAVCMPYYGARTLADLLTAIQKNPDAMGSQQNFISTFLNHGDPTTVVRKSSKGEATSRPVTQSPETSVIANSNQVDAIVWLMKQLAEGLAHAHQRGIVHRDLKPANVLLTDDGLPMLLDFNLSEKIVVNGPASLFVGGTLPYMSPEHLEAVSSGSKVGPQTDIFSLGVIFYELLSGKRPFADHRGSFDDVIQRMIVERKGTTPSLRDTNSWVPHSIESVVEKCLAPDIQNRYGSAEELAEDLGRHLDSRPLRYASEPSISERSRKWLKRHPKLSSGASVAAVASILLLATLTMWFLRGERLARIEAEKTLDLFRQQQPSLYMAIGVPHSEAEILADSIDLTKKALEVYGVLDDREWQSRKVYASLTKTDRQILDHNLGELAFLLARANKNLSRTATDADAKSKLIDEAFELNNLATSMFSKEACPSGLLLQRAKLLDLQGSTEAARALRQQAKSPSNTSRDDANAIDRYWQVYDFLDTRDYQAAKPLLTSLRDRNPTDPVPWLLLGDANAALNSRDESEGCFTTAVALRPGSHLAYLHRGIFRLEKKEYEKALEDFEKIIALRPKLTCGYLNRGLAHAALNHTEKAVEDFTQALDLGATQTRIYFLRSRLRRQLGDREGAAEDLSIGLKSTPTDELSWIARGIAKMKSNPAASLSDFEHALKLNPISLPALRNSIHVLASLLERPQEAKDMINRILDISKNDWKALAGRAVLYAREGKRTEALADVQKLLKASKSPQALFQAACALSLTSSQQKNDLKKAMLLLSRTIQLEPSWLLRANTDPDLTTLRKTEEFKLFVASYRKLNAMKVSLKND